jgi:glucose/arabinose dehydrogenase
MKILTGIIAIAVLGVAIAAQAPVVPQVPAGPADLVVPVILSNLNDKPQGEAEKVVDLPSSTPSLHVSRTINFGPDGRLYVAIDSSCNVCARS